MRRTRTSRHTPQRVSKGGRWDKGGMRRELHCHNGSWDGEVSKVGRHHRRQSRCLGEERKRFGKHRTKRGQRRANNPWKSPCGCKLEGGGRRCGWWVRQRALSDKRCGWKPIRGGKRGHESTEGIEKGSMTETYTAEEETWRNPRRSRWYPRSQENTTKLKGRWGVLCGARNKRNPRRGAEARKGGKRSLALFWL